MLIFSPIDVLPFPKGGPPRLVPLVMGLPTRETAERAKRGEVILGGVSFPGLNEVLLGLVAPMPSMMLQAGLYAF